MLDSIPEQTQPSTHMLESKSTGKPTRVDIIIPVYNALEYVKECVASALRNTDGHDVQLILVNDGSNAETTHYLQTVAALETTITLIEHPENKGYTKTINTGLKSSDATYVILLNSDTVVSKNWLYKLVGCAESAPEVGIVGPLSNAASWQTVPTLLNDNGEFHVNKLPDGMTVDDMGGFIAENSLQIYPKVPFVNGFCFLIKRSLIDKIGLFDEINFPTGYGEENDYCLRASEAGFSLVIADDSYVFHAKSKSFGTEQRDKLSKRGGTALRKKYGQQWFDKKAKEASVNTYLNAIRQSYVFKLFQQTNANNDKLDIDITRQKILFILPNPGVGGGTHSIVQEVDAMRRLGITAHVAIKASNMANTCDQYQAIPAAHELFIGFEDETLLQQAKHYDVVIGTLFSSMQHVKEIVDTYPHILPAYYVQDYEPMFFKEGDENWQIAKDSYTLVPNAVLFAKTHWIARQVIKYHGVYVHKVTPSIDGYIYYPAIDKRDDDRIHISAMIRPRTPRRGPERTIELLSRVNKLHPGKLAFHLFGCDEEDASFKKYTKDFDYTHYGILKRQGVADVLRESDFFIDLSDYQAFGRTALEAMSCGCTAMVPEAGGADEYAIHNINALVVNTMDVDHCVNELDRLLGDAEKLKNMKEQGLATSLHFAPQKAALKELTIFARGIAQHRIATPYVGLESSTQSDQTLSLMSLHDGSLTEQDATRKLKGFMNPQVLEEWGISFIPSGIFPEATKTKVALIQYSNSYKNRDAFIEWIHALHDNGGKCILMPDDDIIDSITNARFDTLPAQHKPSLNTTELFSLCDGVVVSTSYQQQQYKDKSINLIDLPVMLDQKSWLIGQPRPTGKAYFIKKKDAPIRIGYIGSQDSSPHLDVIKKAIHKIEQEYGNKVEVEIIGAFQSNTANPLFGKPIPLPKKRGCTDFITWLQMRVNWDIAILPQSDQIQTTLQDTQVKFLECTALRMASVCTDNAAYRKIVRNNENGLLVSNTAEDWYAALKSLIDSKDLRQKLYHKATADLQESYTMESNTVEYLNVLENIQALTPKITRQNKHAQKQNGGRQPVSGLELSKRRLLKLIRDPHRYFNDSNTKVIRPFRYLFKQKI